MKNKPMKYVQVEIYSIKMPPKNLKHECQLNWILIYQFITY